MEPRGSIVMIPAAIDPRVSFVPLPHARALRVCEEQAPFPDVKGAIVWLRPTPASTDATLAAIAAQLKELGAVEVRFLPRFGVDALLPVEAGSASPLSDVSEVRPVVAELVAELPEGLRQNTALYVEELFASQGL